MDGLSIYEGVDRSSMSELHQEQQGQDGMMECWMHHESSRCAEVVNEIACFIRSGAISFEEVERILRELPNV